MNPVRLFGAFLFLTQLLFLMVFAHAEKVATLPRPQGYVNDYANVMSLEERHHLEAMCVELHDKTRAQVFVVTVNSLEGSSIESFANDLFHTWKIGEKKTDRGVLLLLAIQDHRYRIEVGYGFESILNDAKAGDIGRLAVPRLKDGDYGGALETMLVGVLQVISASDHVALDTLAAKDAAGPTPTMAPLDQARLGRAPSIVRRIVSWLISLSVGAGIFFLPILFPIVLVALWNLFHGKEQQRKHRSSRWISWDSGSSSSSSSSDDSFSGGDGGDSGGGGASGDW